MNEIPHRLIRFVPDADTTPCVCTFDPVKNVLLIASGFYAVLNDKEKEIVWRSKASLTFDDIVKEHAKRYAVRK